MEKQGIIAPGVTPPDDEQQKTAADLEDHVCRRAADAVRDVCGEGCCGPRTDQRPVGRNG